MNEKIKAPYAKKWITEAYDIFWNVHKMHVIKTNHMWFSREKHSRHESVPEKGCKVEKWVLLLPFCKVVATYQAQPAKAKNKSILVLIGHVVHYFDELFK